MDWIYKDIIYEIFTHLKQTSIVRCARVCKLWYVVSKYPSIDVSRNMNFFIFKMYKHLGFDTRLNLWMAQNKSVLLSTTYSYQTAIYQCQLYNLTKDPVSSVRYKIGWSLITEDGVIWKELITE